MGLGRLNEEVRDACSRDYVDKTLCIPSTAGSNVICSLHWLIELLVICHWSSQSRTAANDICLVPLFRDFT